MYTNHPITARDAQGRHGRFREGAEEVQRLPRPPEEVESVQKGCEGTARLDQRFRAAGRRDEQP